MHGVARLYSEFVQLSMILFSNLRNLIICLYTAKISSDTSKQNTTAKSYYSRDESSDNVKCNEVVTSRKRERWEGGGGGGNGNLFTSRWSVISAKIGAHLFK